jgi:hypothetical protein
MDQTIFGFLNGKRESGLCLIDWPTGRGKTTQAEEYICKHAGEHVIFYITPLKKNVYGRGAAYQKTESLFKACGRDDEFRKRAIYIPANLDSVKFNLAKVEPLLSQDIVQEQVYIRLRKAINSLLAIEKKDKHNVPPEVINAANKAESAFRYWLGNYIRRNCGKKPAERLARIRANKNLEPLITLYPAIESSEKSIFFMTVDKFYSHNSTLIEPSYSFLENPLSKNALVFMDEFDACKDAILNRQIEEAATNSIGNIFGLIKKIGDSFDSPMNDDFFSGEKESNGQNAAYVYEALKKKFHEEAREKRLNLAFKYKGERDATKSFIFKDTDHITILEQKKNEGVYLALKEDNPSKNEIFKAKVSDLKCPSLNAALMTAQHDIEFFARGIGSVAKDLMDFAYSVEHRELSISDAVHSCLERFDLSEDEIDYLMPMVLNELTRKKQKNAASFSPDFYERGFSFNSLADQDASYLETKIKSVSLSTTPESFLCSLASRAFVVGLSATASLHSVTGNFDLNYLQSQLGVGFYEPTDEDKERMALFIRKQMKNYRPKIAVEFENKSGDDDEDYGLSESIHSKSAVEYLASQIKGAAIAEDDYNVNRFLKVFKAAYSFLTNRKSKALLVLTNRNMKETGSDLFTRDNLFRLLKEALHGAHRDRRFEILCLDGATFEEKQGSIGLAVKEFGKVIVVSSYPTTGTGQNLQYTDDNGKEKDLDSLYLESPTNLVVNLDSVHDMDPTKATETLLRYCYQVEALALSGGISPEEKRVYIKYAFKKRINSMAKLEYADGHLYSCSSTNLYGVRILAQATGRISRTKNKKGNVHIYLDDEIVKNYDFRLLNKTMFVEEFQAIIDACNQKRTMEISEVNRERINACLNRSNAFSHRLWSILSGTKEKWAEGQQNEWRGMREYFLHHPTLSREELVSSPYASAYFEAPENQKFTCYYYEVENENITDVFYEKPARGVGIEVSETAARLSFAIANKELRAFMETKGYPIAFVPSDAILNPVAFTNIYKGALGEVVVKWVLDQYGLTIDEITDGAKFEKFDFVFHEYPNVYVDAKNWSEMTAAGGNQRLGAAEILAQALSKLELIGGDKAIIIETFVKEAGNPHREGDGKVLVVPTLFDVEKPDCPIRVDVVAAIREYLEDTHNGN